MNTYNNYAYKILSDESRILKKAIKEGNWSNHPEALKDRLLKVRQLENALKIIQNSQGSTYRNTEYPYNLL